MKTLSSGIAVGAEGRLRKAIGAQVRLEHEAELAATNDYWQKVEIEAKIQREVKKRMKQVSSPHSLWGSL